MLNCGGVAASSFLIVPVPWPSAMVAPLALARFTAKVSSASTVASPLMVTGKVTDVRPAAMLRPVWLAAR
jgi:hypothetical protein